MAKAAKRNVPAPVAPVASEAQEITLALIDQVSSTDPYFMFVPADVSAEWVTEGLVETNPEMADATGAIATRLTEKGKHSLMNTTAATAASTPAPVSNDFDFEIEDGPMPIKERASVANAAKYPFDALTAPTVDAEGNSVCKRFFVPATASRPDPAKSLASTVSTAKDRYSKVTGEREYKAKEVVKNADGSPVLGADGQPATREVTKTRAVKEYEREFRITAGEKNGVKGAWISRVK